LVEGCVKLDDSADRARQIAFVDRWLHGLTILARRK
jgi:hypothetical protein